MARKPLNPEDYGIKMSRKALVDRLVLAYFELYQGGGLTIDELVLRPREALFFCDHVRKTHGFYELPDDVILRILMNHRKASQRFMPPPPEPPEYLKRLFDEYAEEGHGP